jgi:hypothetical protein
MIADSRVRRVVASFTFEIPKSRIFTSRCSSPSTSARNRFSGLRSRCTMPRLWAAVRPETVWRRISATRASGWRGWASSSTDSSRPLEELHHQVRIALRRAVEVDHVHDVRVPQAGGHLGLAAKAGQHLLVRGEVAQQHLDGVAAREARVGGLVDLAHAPRPIRRTIR